MKIFIGIIIILLALGIAGGIYYLKTSNNVTGIGHLTGKLTIGPICPLERPDLPCTPGPEVYAAHKIIIYDAHRTHVIKEIVAGADGNYQTDLTAGDYIVDVERSGIGSGTGVPQSIHISDGQTVKIDIDVDTGIR